MLAKMLWTLLLLTLVTSCRLPPTNLSQFQLDAVQATAMAWPNHGLPALPAGLNLKATQVRATNDASEFFSICHAIGASCFRELGTSRNPYFEIVLWPNQTVDIQGEPIVHETCHYLMKRAGLPADYWHTDPRVWSERSEFSVQSTARSLMTSPK